MTAPALTDGSARAERRAFYLRRLHSLSGVVPLGAFVVMHLWTNAAALGGRDAFDRAVTTIQEMPFLPVIEVFGVLLPLAFHAAYGIVIAARGRANAPAYPFSSNWLYLLQRVSGVVILLFVLGHLWEFRVQKWLYGMGAEAFHDTLEAHLSWTWAGVPWIALGYLAGVGASVFHLANGLVGFAMTWGIATTRVALRRIASLSFALGALLFMVALTTILQLATGTRLLPEQDAGKNAPCGPSPRGAEANRPR
jgi:succinate dehydrogenase/fumarate reductase cytochrome b subunit (b558 family)